MRVKLKQGIDNSIFNHHTTYIVNRTNGCKCNKRFLYFESFKGVRANCKECKQLLNPGVFSDCNFKYMDIPEQITIL
jgi:hypothetical protein